MVSILNISTMCVDEPKKYEVIVCWAIANFKLNFIVTKWHGVVFLFKKISTIIWCLCKWDSKCKSYFYRSYSYRSASWTASGWSGPWPRPRQNWKTARRMYPTRWYWTSSTWRTDLAYFCWHGLRPGWSGMASFASGACFPPIGMGNFKCSGESYFRNRTLVL